MRIIYKAIQNPKPTVLRIANSDARFRAAFRDFTSRELMLAQGEFIPISVAGGPAAFAHQAAKKEDFNYLLNQIIFFLGHCKSISKIILIGHEDCGFYETIRNHSDQDDKEKNDLPVAKEILQALFAHLAVESYYASFADEERTEIVFEEV